MKELLLSFHDEDTHKAVLAERTLLRKLEGGCQVPIGAYAQIKPNELHLDAMVGKLDGSLTFRKKARGSKNKPEQLGINLANVLLKAGAKEILDEIYNSVRVNQNVVA